VTADGAAMRGKNVIFVSLLEPWSIAKDVGAPSFYETLRGYARAGAHLHYLTSEKSGSGDDAHVRQIAIELPGITVHRFRIPQVFRSQRLQSKAVRLLLFPLLAARRLRTLVAETSADLVYAYESSAILAVHWLQLRRALSVPVIARYQGTILGARYADVPFALRKLESLLSLRAPASGYVMTNDGTFGDRALRHWNRRVSPSNLLFIRNGIDLSISRHEVDRSQALRDRGLDPGHTYMLTVCRLAAWKRVDRAIRILAALQSDFPRLRLLVCGDGPARPALEQAARDARIADKVHFLGAQPRSEVAVWMHAADLFLSLYDVSNCGNPLFEALLLGKPLVTLDNGATASVIVDGVNGRLVDPRAEDSLPDVVRELLCSAEQRQRLSRGALAWAEQELYSWEERLSREISWLQQLIPAMR
jgi:glycosyltransferase involved in cell wall biosynthesis